MKITKFGHSCLLIEIGGLRVLVDPGIYSIKQNELRNLDLMIITHEHQDHYDINSVKSVIQNNQQAKILTNESVTALLEKEGLNRSRTSIGLLEDGSRALERDVSIEGVGARHAVMHSSIPPVENVGYFIADRFFYPGDSFVKPKKSVEILGLPLTGPWLKLPEVIDYALEIKPKICIPMHEGILKSPATVYRIASQVLEQNRIKFIIPELDKEYEF